MTHLSFPTLVLRQAAVVGVAAGSCLALAVAPAAATIGEYVDGTRIILTSDADADTISLTCVGGQARHQGADLMSCAGLTYLSLQGGDGADTLDVSSLTRADFPALTQVSLHGGDDADTIRGSQLGDDITADSVDTVAANDGDDEVAGGGSVTLGAGDDLATATFGSVDGGPGDDRFDGISNGPVIGGPGTDTLALDFTTAPAGVVTSFVITSDNFHFRAELAPIPAVEADISVAAVERYEIELPTSGTNQVDARAFPGQLDLVGKGGADTFLGGPGEDFLDGGSGVDQITGGPGFDYIVAGPGDDTVTTRDGEPDRVLCGDGTDTVVADASDLLVACETVQLPVSPPAIATTPETGAVSGPKKVSVGKKAVFSFSSPTAGATFQCQLDGKGAWKTCASPYSLKTRKLKAGKHTLAVRAVAGSTDATPAVRKFKIVGKK
jgi:hypothetical protein